MLLSRRQFIARASLGLGAGALGAAAALRSSATAQAESQAALGSRLAAPHHLAFVWQFDQDGSPAAIRDVLAAHGLGVALKSHDGPAWMASYDRSPYAVTGPDQVSRLVEFFESAGVPLHAWCVVKGLDPQQEAAMGAQVLAAGARSLILDVEPHPGFWMGTPRDAAVFGEELRRRQPNASVTLSVDPRPWHLAVTPVREFAPFCDALAPQIYWEEFSSAEHLTAYIQSGVLPGATGITPAFLLGASAALRGQYGLPICPIGQGAASRPEAWEDFMRVARDQGAATVSVWRFGVTRSWVWDLLAANPPGAGAGTYMVQPGDSLSALAGRWGTTVPAIVTLNGIKDPNHLSVGQLLLIPGRTRDAGPGPASASAAQSAGYTVQPGDTLSALARRWNTTVDRIAAANQLPSPDVITVGMQLRVP